MRIDALALQMRPRAPHEAADLGVRLCQAKAREIYRCYFVAAIPLVVLALSLYEIAAWLPMAFLWCSKPWLDRTVLFVLSRAAFGQSSTVGDLWRAQRAVWWRGFLLTWTWRRLSPYRSFTQPAYQLEGHPFGALRKRVTQLRRRHSGAAALLTGAFSCAESGLWLAVLSMAYWVAPDNQSFDLSAIFAGESNPFAAPFGSVAYALVVLFLEPFYVAAGFGMYLNRRAELEAWDIEQEFRRAFAG